MFKNFDLNEIARYIDWAPFFQTWDLAGPFPEILKDEVVGEEARRVFSDGKRMLQRLIEGRWLSASAVVGLYPANSVGDDDIELYTDESRREVALTWHGLRQQTERFEVDGVMRPSRCLADFVAPKGVADDYVGVFAVTAVICGLAGALYYPQAGIINPAELAPIASIYLAVWVAIGGRGRLYGAVIGAASVSLLSSVFTSGRLPNIPLGPVSLNWVDWWLVILGLSFVAVTLFAPKGIGGLFDRFQRIPTPDRKGAPLGADDGSLQEQEAQP
ncbi:MAG: hypothetical protein B7Y02_10885 [Rhodobacterales bacterium 17-64-5]|nr:MAG: hypothetical protein B7Y02_10885 [Rhodobacterales bacterium 17-64-5]